MRTWKRTPLRLFCGYCGEEIRRGEPVLILSSPDGKWQKARCEQCAGEKVPELPPLEVPAVVQSRPMRKVPMFSAVGAMARDWKIRQAGE